MCRGDVKSFELIGSVWNMLMTVGLLFAMLMPALKIIELFDEDYLPDFLFDENYPDKKRV